MRDHRTWVLIGVLLFAAVVAWRLIGPSYKGDLKTICNAEQGSGVTLKLDHRKLGDWVTSHLQSPEGNALFNEMQNKGMGERSKRLSEAAKSAGVDPCPMVEAYAQAQAEGDYRADLARICAGQELPPMVYLEDDERMKKLEEWAATKAKSARTKELVTKLEAQPDVKERARLLRAEADEQTTHHCELAETLEKPRVPPPPGASGPQVRFLPPQLNGDITNEDVTKQLQAHTPELKKCYETALAGSPNLAGRVLVKIQIAQTGKVTNATSAQKGVLPNLDMEKCVLAVFQTFQFPAQKTPATTLMLPVDFTPTP